MCVQSIDTANSSVDSPKLVKNSFWISVLCVVCCFYLHVCLFVCLIDLVTFYHFLFSFLFISNTCSLNVHANIEASSSQSMGKTNPVPGFDQPTPPLEY